MGEIYCLYCTSEGLPRYVGRTDASALHRLKQHITAALEMAEGPLYDWMRRCWKDDIEVRCFVLQTNVPARDVDMYERYWVAQFDGLLNIHLNAAEDGRPTEVGSRAIKESIVATIDYQEHDE